MQLTLQQTRNLAQAATEKLAARWPVVYRRMWVRTLMALAMQESRLDPGAKNPNSTATGLMQILKATQGWLETRLGLPNIGQQALYDPGYSMLLAAEYLAYLYSKKAGRSWDKAVVAYNQGHYNTTQAGKNYLAAVRKAYAGMPFDTVNA